MNLLTDVFYWITTGLLVPVMALLLLGFFYSLVTIASFYGFYSDRIRSKKEIAQVLLQIDEGGVGQCKWLEIIKHHPIFTNTLQSARLHNWEETRSNKVLSDFEMKAEQSLEKSRILMRIGPMLGLMGTLIPMGPALVGLATGDIEAMAMNMQIAFSTTVIGLFIGGVGFTTYNVRQRWFSEDLHNLDFIIQLAQKDHEA